MMRIGKLYKFLFSVLFFLMFFLPANAQSTDLARVEYTYFPQSSSDNSFRQFKALLAFPIKLGEKSGYLVPGIEYENVNFKFEDNAPFQKKGELDRFQSFTFSLGYTFKMQNNWRFAVWNGFLAASNFETGTLINDDLVYTGAIGFIKDEDEVEKPWRLIFGLYYSTKSKRSFPLPVINYYRRFQPDWSYTLGVPKTNLKYYLSEKSEFQAFVRLDGFYANLQEDRFFTNSDKVAESISMTIVLAGLGYEYNFTEHLSFYLYAGYTVYNDFRLRNAEKEDIYQVNNMNTFHARTGLKFNIF
ncbi:MAG TPA: DUF6268 family outer membrane beta-barrel protein [Salinimicrobium sp.]|nr:DUF6268 family outer membrane beta-barrel protein [Salinimicrobium sp.]